MDTSVVTSKGQMVIPSRIRKKYAIKEGTRVNLIEHEGAILLQPVTEEYVQSLKGILQVKPGDKGATETLLDAHDEELKKEAR